MNCRICTETAAPFFKAEVLKKYQVQYFRCTSCGFVCTEEPYWLKEAYENSINDEDTGLLQRNISLRVTAANLAAFFFDADKTFLDYAGGYGVFTRLMRDAGYDWRWKDLYSQNLLAKGFEFTDRHKAEMVSSFESFEHFADPQKELEKILMFSSNILFTTELLPEPAPAAADWWYYGLAHGQHVSFYTAKALKLLAAKNGLHYIHRRNLHLFTAEKISRIKFTAAAGRFRKLFFYLYSGRRKSLTWQDYLSITGD